MPPRNRNRDLDHQIDVLNNLNLEKTETKFYLQENGNANTHVDGSYSDIAVAYV